MEYAQNYIYIQYLIDFQKSEKFMDDYHKYTSIPRVFSRNKSNGRQNFIILPWISGIPKST